MYEPVGFHEGTPAQLTAARPVCGPAPPLHCAEASAAVKSNDHDRNDGSLAHGVPPVSIQKTTPARRTPLRRAGYGYSAATADT